MDRSIRVLGVHGVTRFLAAISPASEMPPRDAAI
jgi:hypothetical protein